MSDYWESYTKKMIVRIENPRSLGAFTPEEANSRNMRFVEGIEGSYEEGNIVHFFWLVDETDGIIVDAKFQVFGLSALIAAADVGCDLVCGKNHAQIKRLTAELIDKELRDKQEVPAFTLELVFLINLVLDAFNAASFLCQDLVIPQPVTPLPCRESQTGEYPEWSTMEYDEKIAAIEKLLNEEVRPYIELDAGGIEVLKLIDDRELVIAYSGACTTCYSSVGSTLASIQQIVQTHIHPEIIVVPNLDDLQL